MSPRGLVKTRVAGPMPQGVREVLAKQTSREYSGDTDAGLGTTRGEPPHRKKLVFSGSVICAGASDRRP